jgi:uncharacterized protein (TIGR02217 family)
MESGRNRRKVRRAVALHRYVLPYNNISAEFARAIKRVHMAVRGAAHTFLHLDYLDFEATDEQFGIGDGTTTVFQLQKTYDPGGGATYERDITKPDTTGAIDGTPLTIKKGGVLQSTGYTVSAATGEVTFSVAPAVGAVLTWSGRHYVCVRFNRDDLPFTIDNKSGDVFVTNGSLELIEELTE